MTPEYIYAHELVYNYLVNYFLPDLSDPYFRQDAAHEIEQDERMTYCCYMAAWLPHEPHYNQILNKLKQLCESDRKAVCLWVLLSLLPVSAMNRLLAEGEFVVFLPIRRYAFLFYDLIFWYFFSSSIVFS